MSLAALAATVVTAVAPTPEAPIVVDGKPISRGALRHWVEIHRRASGDPTPPPAEPIDREMAARFLINRRWLMGEAQARGIVVRRGDVSAEFRTQRREAFPRLEDYRAFLRESGQTRRDLRTGVRMSLLADRILEQELVGVIDPLAQEQAEVRLVRAMRRTWKPRTVCLPRWAPVRVRTCR